VNAKSPGMAAYETRPVSPILGVEIVGVDLRKPFEPGFAEAMWQELDRHHLLLFRDQDISPEDQVRMVTIFGPISKQGAAERAGHGDVSYISNAHPEGRGGEGELFFHSDQASLPKPVRVLSLYGQQVTTTGGETLYSSMVRAHEILPDQLKDRIAPLHLQHSYDYDAYFKKIKGYVKDEASTAPRQVSAIHPVSMPHPRTGRPSLYVNEVHSKRIVELSEEESKALLQELLSYVRRKDNIYEHRWKVGDLVIWDNLALLHARTPWNLDEPRTLQRVQVG
jgi:taurine dioxygenase